MATPRVKLNCPEGYFTSYENEIRIIAEALSSENPTNVSIHIENLRKLPGRLKYFKDTFLLNDIQRDLIDQWLGNIDDWIREKKVPLGVLEKPTELATVNKRGLS